VIGILLRVLGSLFIAIGVLWALQGAGVVHIKPVACVADCVELQGFSAQWLFTGLVATGLGIAFWYWAHRRARLRRK
jgi:drug/metabolite transporter (DMT)-like permease